MQIMSAPSLQSDSGAAPVAAERRMLDAAIALAPTISLERVAHETAQQLRRAIACDAIAIALSDAEFGPFELVHQIGFNDDRRELASALLSSWERAVTEGITVLRDRERATELTVPIASGRVRGAITIVVGSIESPQQLEEIESLVASIGAQTASAIDRARDVDRLTQRRRLQAISEVSAGIARELRNPLFGISSAAQLLRFRVRDAPVVERNVGRILREVERLNAIVSSLLE